MLSSFFINVHTKDPRTKSFVSMLSIVEKKQVNP